MNELLDHDVATKLDRIFFNVNEELYVSKDSEKKSAFFTGRSLWLYFWCRVSSDK